MKIITLVSVLALIAGGIYYGVHASQQRPAATAAVVPPTVPTDRPPVDPAIPDLTSYEGQLRLLCRQIPLKPGEQVPVPQKLYDRIMEHVRLSAGGADEGFKALHPNITFAIDPFLRGYDRIAAAEKEAQQRLATFTTQEIQRVIQAQNWEVWCSGIENVGGGRGTGPKWDSPNQALDFGTVEHRSRIPVILSLIKMSDVTAQEVVTLVSGRRGLDNRMPLKRVWIVGELEAGSMAGAFIAAKRMIVERRTGSTPTHYSFDLSLGSPARG